MKKEKSKNYISIRLIQATPYQMPSTRVRMGGDTLETSDSFVDGYTILDEGVPVRFMRSSEFDKEFRVIESFTFSIALTLLIDGHKVTRRAWKKKGLFLKLYDHNDYINLGEGSGYPNLKPFVGMSMEDEQFEPYTPLHDDLLSEDWDVVE